MLDISVFLCQALFRRTEQATESDVVAGQREREKMLVSFTPKFGRRDNPDGTFASMCLNCFETVATAMDPQKLFAAESQHKCWKDPGEGKATGPGKDM